MSERKQGTRGDFYRGFKQGLTAIVGVPFEGWLSHQQRMWLWERHDTVLGQRGRYAAEGTFITGLVMGAIATVYWTY